MPRPRISPVTIAAGIGVLALIVVAVVGPIVWGTAAETTSAPDRSLSPSPDHPFGTDELGRDIFARVMVAMRLSLALALGATATAVVGGVTLGLVAALAPRHPRRALIGMLDILLAFPGLLVVLIFSAIWGASAVVSMLAIGLASIPSVGRLAYTLASSLSGRDFVRAARVVGVGPIGLMRRHILPNMTGPLLVNAAAMASVCLLTFAGLSFIGLGVQAPDYDLGRLLREGTLRIYTNPMAALGPGIAIVAAGLAFTLLSEAISSTRGGGVGAVGNLARQAAGLPAAATAAASDGRAATTPPVAEVRGLGVAFPDATGTMVECVRGVDLTIARGETVGIVGESGSGKSLTAMAMAGLLEAPARVTAATRTFDGIDLSRPLSRAEAARVGSRLGMVFQDPLTSLNPSLTIGRQMTEVPMVHLGMSRAAARDRAVASLEAVGIADSRRRMRRYPHEFSGGMRQRAMIGMSLSADPLLIIADEPTTALDVTVQHRVMAVLRRAQRETGAAIVFISHDIALVSAFCDRIVVMKDGSVVEEVAAARIRQDARHPYTRALLACLPDMSADRTRPLPVIGPDLVVAGEPRQAEPARGSAS